MKYFLQTFTFVFCLCLSPVSGQYVGHVDLAGDAPEDVFLRLLTATNLFEWFTPIHMKGAFPNIYRQTRESGSEAYRSYMDALPLPESPPPENRGDRGDQRISFRML